MRKLNVAISKDNQERLRKYGMVKFTDDTRQIVVIGENLTPNGEIMISVRDMNTSGEIMNNFRGE